MTGSNLCVLTSAVLSVTVTTVVKVLPSVETLILKARVFQSLLSPPAPEWRRMTLEILAFEPRSTCNHLESSVEHHLSPVPPETLPLNACAGFSSSLQGVLPVAGRCKARFLGVCPSAADAQRISARRAALRSGIMICHLSRHVVARAPAWWGGPPGPRRTPPSPCWQAGHGGGRQPRAPPPARPARAAPTRK